MAHNTPSKGDDQKMQYGNHPIKNTPVESVLVQPSSPYLHHSPMRTPTQQVGPRVNQDDDYQIRQHVIRSGLQDVVKEVEASMVMRKEVEDILVKSADKCVVASLYAASLKAKSKNATSVEAKDVQVEMDRLTYPDIGNNRINPRKRAAVPVAIKFEDKKRPAPPHSDD